MHYKIYIAFFPLGGSPTEETTPPTPDIGTFPCRFLERFVNVIWIEDLLQELWCSFSLSSLKKR